MWRITSIITLTTIVWLNPFWVSAQEQIDSSATEEIIPEKKRPYGIFDMFDGNPGKAALYSLVIPGAGQFYNKRYWKVPIVWAAEGVAIGVLINNLKIYNNRKDIYRQLISGETDCILTICEPEQFKPYLDSARQYLEFSYLAVGIIHLINVADAFVDRHLIEFDVTDDLSFRLQPAMYHPGIAVVFEFK